MAILHRHSAIQGHPHTHPVHSQLLEIARHKVVSAASRAGIVCKQTCAKEGKTLRRKTVARQSTILSAVMGKLQRKLGAYQAAVAARGAPAIEPLIGCAKSDYRVD